MATTNKKTNQKTSRSTSVLYIIFSIVASLALWTYVTVVVNPEKTTDITNIPIVFEGEDVLLDNNLVVTSVNTRDLDIRFSGRWNSLSVLSDANITATVDLSEIISRYSANAGTYPLSYKLNYGSGVSTLGISTEYADYTLINVTVEKIVSRTIPVSGTFDGNVETGYTAEPLQLSTESITVSGQQAVVSKIASAAVSLGRDNVSKTINEEVPIVLYDADGKVIDQEGLILSQDTLTVTLRVLMVKDIPLVVNIAGGLSASEENTTHRISPQFVTVSGEAEDLAGLNQIVLGTIDLTKFATAATETFTIPFPNNVTNLSGETTAEVSVQILGLSIKRLSTTNIQTSNVTDGYVPSVITQSLDVQIRGNDISVNAVRPENIRIVADLSELGSTTGTYSVVAKAYVDGFSDVDVIGEYRVTVILQTENEAMQNRQPEPEPIEEPGEGDEG